MDEFYAILNEFVPDLLIMARTEKRIDVQTFERLYGILIELENRLKGEEYIPRRIAGFLYFIYTSLSAETEYCSYNDELFIAVAKLEDIIGRILWESPFKN